MRISIGTLSKRTGVHIETVRFYERRGLLPKPQRTVSGRRVYDEDDVARLTLVRHARGLGFDLASIGSLLELRERPERSCAKASELAAAQLAIIENRLSQITALRDELRQLAGNCGNGRVSDCRVIQALEM